MTTGERIKEARLRAGLTQSELAEKIGVKFSAVHKYETGMIVNLKRDTISAIAKALNVKPSWLMCMDDVKCSEDISEDTYDGSVLQNLIRAPQNVRELSFEERQLIMMFRLVKPEERELVLSMIRAALSSQK